MGTDAELPPLEGEAIRVHHLDAYAPYGRGLFLIRPDGYVGWAGEDASGTGDRTAAGLGVAARMRVDGVAGDCRVAGSGKDCRGFANTLSPAPIGRPAARQST
ncbi:hypothetical protein [Streptomyces sp. NPDC088725]|uniref:hypothetical protein n=1 Tax=Streptomyces sp. NPDC088725 TaxID=3365873 RepID=UPI0037FB9C6F